MSLATKIKSAAAVAPHIIVEALAGTGKTTTLIEGLKRLKGLPTSITPSPQQAAVWEAMESGNAPKSINFVAFNKSIAMELAKKVPAGCSAMTMHSMGFKSVTNVFKLNRGKSVNGWRTANHLEELTGKRLWDMKKEDPDFVNGCEKLVGLCKVNLTEPTLENLDDLASHYNVPLNGSRAAVYEYVPQLIERAKEVEKDGYIDFNDMIWLPVVLNLDCEKFDLLLWDEAQDGNLCQQALAQKCGRRLLLCGDMNQAIYGFAGADSDSLNRMNRILAETEQGCTVLPLTVTRRCGRAIVNEAQRLVPTFEAHESNGDGLVTSTQLEKYRDAAADGDMVLCRTNAPLVSECFKFLRMGRRANIQGRDIGTNLINLIKRMFKVEGKGAGKRNPWEGILAEQTSTDLISRLTDWCSKETLNENAKKNPSAMKVGNIEDKVDCLCLFAEGTQNVQEVVQKINDIFTDDNTSGVLFSSGHKSKGLEADRVFILDVVPYPHPMAEMQWEIQGEHNLRYVMQTRDIQELVYVYTGNVK